MEQQTPQLMPERVFETCLSETLLVNPIQGEITAGACQGQVQGNSKREFFHEHQPAPHADRLYTKDKIRKILTGSSGRLAKRD